MANETVNGVVGKRKLIEEIVDRLQGELQAHLQAAKAAHEAATHEESKAEDQHDTRGLEASYLAGAQANRAAELQRLVLFFRNLPLREFANLDPIDVGALIELEHKGRKNMYFLVSQGGGISISREGRTIQVITPQAPLGEALLGKKSGDSVEVESQNQVREYEIISVQ